MEILYAVLGIIALIIIAGVLYFVCSPMPVVRLLRRKMDGEIFAGMEEDVFCVTIVVRKA